MLETASEPLAVQPSGRRRYARLSRQSLLTARYTATGANASQAASAINSGIPHCARIVGERSDGVNDNARLVAAMIPIATATPAATAIACTMVITREAVRTASWRARRCIRHQIRPELGTGAARRVAW